MDFRFPQLRSLRRRLKWLVTARTILVALFCFGAPAPVVVALAASGAPWWVLWPCWLLSAAVLTSVLRPFEVEATDLAAAARRAERRYPELGDELTTALELAEEEDVFVVLQRRRAQRLAAAFELREAAPAEALRRPGLAMAGLVMVYLAFALAAPTAHDLGWRGLFGGSTTPPPPRVTAVEPGDARLAPTSVVVVSATFDRPPGEPRLELRPRGGGAWRELELTRAVDSAVEYTTELPPLTEPLEYRVLHTDGVSATYKLELLPTPRLEDLRLRVVPPAYTGLEPREPAAGEGSVAAPRGSRIGFSAAYAPRLAAARLIINGDEETPPELEPAADGGRLSGAFRLLADGFWRLELSAANGLESATADYRLAALEDAPPSVELLEPRGVWELDVEMTVPVVCRVADDYGVAGLELVHRRRDADGGLGEPRRTSVADNLGPAARVAYRWELGAAGLFPGDELLCRLIVRDGNAVDGPQSGVSAPFVVRFPGLDELVEVESFQAPQERLEELEERQRRLSDRAEELARRNRGAEEVSWEERRAVEELLQEQERVVSDAEETLRRLEAAAETLSRENLITPETLDKLNEVQRLLHQALDEELRDRLSELQRAVEGELERADIEELAREFDQSREEFEQGLDRMRELLQRAEAEQRLAELVQRAAEAAERAAERATDPQAQTDEAQGDDLADEARSLSEQAAAVAGKLGELEDEAFRRAGDQVAAAGDELERSGVADRPSANQLQHTAGALSEFSSQTASALAELRGAQHQQLQRVLTEQIAALILLARRQQGVVEAAALGDGASLGPREAEIAAGVRRVAAGLEAVYRQTVFADQDLLRRFDRLAQRLDDSAAGAAGGDPPPARVYRGYLADLNNLALELLELQQTAAGAESSTGLSEMMARLGELAAQQQGLNQATQQAAAGQGGQPTSGPGPLDLRSLAARQAAIAQGLRDLQQRHGELGNGRGDLGEMAGQAGEIADELETGALGDSVERGQQQLYRRLLDAQRALQTEELDRRRESTTAGAYTVEPPPPLEITPAEDTAPLRPARERLDPGMFPHEYRQAVREYLRRLEGE